MNLGLLFLKVNTLGVITLSELDWITNHQSEFSRLDMALIINLKYNRWKTQKQIIGKTLRELTEEWQ